MVAIYMVYDNITAERNKMFCYVCNGTSNLQL